MREIASELERRGRRPYIISRGGAMAPGVLGYAYAMFEILQLKASPFRAGMNRKIYNLFMF
jgi:1-aminocyclopropane-1-carboxylate deaminase/D-cysteine desulfhydrase-like pyridoxal-dependent ACC family enzyme